MLKGIKNKIKNQDCFTSQISLNYKPEQKIYKTLTGGISFILINLLLIVITGFNLQKMFMRQQSVISSTTSKVDPSELGLINLQDTNLLFFIHVTGGGITNKTSLEELSQFVDIFYQRVNTTALDSSRIRIEAKRCTQEDFGFDPKSVEYFNTYIKNGRNLFYSLCPDLKEKQAFLSREYYGNNANYGQNSFQIRVNYCLKNCKSPREVNQFLQNFRVQLHLYGDHMDFNQYNGRPVQRYVIDSQTLSAFNFNTTYQSWFDIQQNRMKLQDNYFEIWATPKQDMLYDVQTDKNYITNNQISSLQDIKFANFNFQLDDSIVLHQRKSYNFINVLSDVGGAYTALIIIAQLILNPIINQSFLLSIFMQLYKVKIKDPNFFKPNNQLQLQNFNKQRFQTNIIDFTLHDIMMMKLSMIFGCFNKKCLCFCRKIWPKQKYIVKLFEKGNKQLNRELSIIEIIRSLRKSDIFLKSDQISSKMKQEFLNDVHNYIDLDTTEDESQAVHDQSPQVNPNDENISASTIRNDGLNFVANLNPNSQYAQYDQNFAVSINSSNGVILEDKWDSLAQKNKKIFEEKKETMADKNKNYFELEQRNEIDLSQSKNQLLNISFKSDETYNRNE